MIILFDRVFSASKARIINMDWIWGHPLGGFPPLADLATYLHSFRGKFFTKGGRKQSWGALTALKWECAIFPADNPFNYS
jgi:hypothetical protein